MDCHHPEYLFVHLIYDRVFMHDNPEIYIVTIIGIILGVLLVGFIFTILFLYQRRQRRQEVELERLKDMHEKEVLRSQLEIQENTFKAIAQELHDNIGQMLSVVKLTLSMLPMDKEHHSYEMVNTSKEVLNKAIYDLSNLTKSLHTDRIAEIGLAESIRFELYAIRNTGILAVQFHQEGDSVHFNEQTSIFLFRIFQEALNNILKHSGATEVIVNLKFLFNIFTMEIRDNGKGFKVNEKRHSGTSYSGVGLKSMFNRAKLLGADLAINSTPGDGTVISIELPLKEQQ
jgi:signal transduction histidine kinase